ncbi:hypothetical protein C2845_PM07G00710 [Panicum miliaceum]|uniref:KIB1-4 beta-propeller domain-containing protein n=1 Tax=Panicum miliaceum TaxID=4540 RepID=A0A3L6SQT3_PANMI|nr:hypothetical protein C2845_PM07G00710 [Panicum miliaceum]
MESTPAEDLSPLSSVASSFPLLVYDYDHGDPPDTYQTVLSVADGSMRTFQVPEMCSQACLETPCGLVLVADTVSPRCSLWNPQTGEKIALPAMDRALPVYLRRAYLLESCRELFLVCLFYRGCNFERIEEVAAYRMDFSKQEWCKVTDIGDRVFLLGPANFAASCSATEHGLKKGRVYFAYDFLGDSKKFHIFDLKEGTRELAAPTQDIPVLSREPFWMVPVVP